jgi:hypothetical protein
LRTTASLFEIAPATIEPIILACVVELDLLFQVDQFETALFCLQRAALCKEALV